MGDGVVCGEEERGGGGGRLPHVLHSLALRPLSPRSPGDEAFDASVWRGMRERGTCLHFLLDAMMVFRCARDLTEKGGEGSCSVCVWMSQNHSVLPAAESR